MALNLNRFVVGGNLTRDAEQRTTPNGKGVINFSIANNQGFGENADVSYFNVTLFSESEKLANILTKGVQVVVSGRVRIRRFEKDGNTQYYTEVIADPYNGVQLVGNRSSQSESVEFEDDTDEDVPF